MLQPGGVCCRLFSARLSLSAPFTSDNDNDGRGIMGERKWMEKRWRWVEEKKKSGEELITSQWSVFVVVIISEERWSLISIFFDC